VRQASDILMGVERAFINPHGLPDRPDFKDYQTDGEGKRNRRQRHHEEPARRALV